MAYFSFSTRPFSAISPRAISNMLRKDSANRPTSSSPETSSSSVSLSRLIRPTASLRRTRRPVSIFEENSSSPTATAMTATDMAA